MAIFSAGLLVAPSMAADRVSYNRDVRPLLSDRCFQCHGPDPDTRAAGLRLDSRETATAEADSGYVAVVPGDASESELVARITSADADLVMPPPDSGKSLTAAEISLLRRWVEQGAEYQPHWAFVPPQKVDPPERPGDQWSHSAIDRFVLAELQRHDLRPSPAAERVTLLRRVTLDLTGLPPTREEMAAFLADSSPAAYERAVDRLLASPRYGEHMARYWLDAVRYGDTHGLHLDNYREMWPYRDWVVRAFNANLPWDDFTTMQLAGDLLPEPTLDDEIATGFNRCHVTTNEGGSIAEEVYVRNVVDRVSTTGTVFLGLTMGCAVCHDHKFDPITARDFYSSFAFFNNLDGAPMDGNTPSHAPVVKAPSPEQAKQLETLHREIADVERQMAQPWPKIDALQAAWESTVIDTHAAGELPAVSAGPWYSVGPFVDDVRYLQSKTHGPEGKAIDVDETFRDDAGELLRWTSQPSWVDGQIHTDLSYKTSASFLYRSIRSSQEQAIDIGLGTDDGARVYLNGELAFKTDAVREVRLDEDRVTLKLRKGDNQLLIKVINNSGLSGFCFTMPSAANQMPIELLEILTSNALQRTDEQSAVVRRYFRYQVCQQSGMLELIARLGELREELTELEGQVPTTLVMRERAEPRPAYLLRRGQYDAADMQLGPLPRAVPGFLPPLPEGVPANRLGYAKWLVADDHPLMARVTVNRFWQQCFGTGLVETADDFGSQGAWPSHPELLDWLAVDFRQHGWDVKRLMKQLVMSSAYQQTSRTTPELQTIDPRNRLLARGPRFRLDAEVLRDQALAVSGLLVNELGGPGVRPPQPSGLWEAVAYSGSNTREFVADSGPEKVHRRSLYTFWKRTSPPPQFSTLDAPSRESCVVRRERTNTPLAALLLLNDPQYVEAARALAQRSMQQSDHSPSDVARVMLATAMLRSPNEREVLRMVELYQQTLDRYAADGAAADRLLSVGEAAVDQELDRAELAAWTLAANAVLNLDEVLNKE